MDIEKRTNWKYILTNLSSIPTAPLALGVRYLSARVQTLTSKPHWKYILTNLGSIPTTPLPLALGVSYFSARVQTPTSKIDS